MPPSVPTMSGRVAEGRPQVPQIYRLLQFVHDGDEVQIVKMVNMGWENIINLTEPQEGTGVLHLAVSINKQDMLSFLLSQGADPNIHDKRGRTPAMVAAELGNEPLLSLLAQSNADMALKDAEGKGVLFYCSFPTMGHTQCLQVALKFKADVNNVSVPGTHVFQFMCERALEQTASCLIMLESGTDPAAISQDTGITALMAAAKSGSPEVVRAILRKGGDLSALDPKRLSAVHYAAMGGSVEVLQVLSAYSADMGKINLDLCTPLHYAAATGIAACCKFLAQRGCNPKLKNQDGFLPRQIAKDAGHKAALKILKKAEKQEGAGKVSWGSSVMSCYWALTLHDWSNEYEAELRQAFGLDPVTKETFISVLEELKAPATNEQLQTVFSAHEDGKQGFFVVNEFFKGVKYIEKTCRFATFLPKKKKEKKKKGGKKKKGKFVLPMPICTLPPELMPLRQDGGRPEFMIESYANCSYMNRFDLEHPPDHPIMNDSAWYIDRSEMVYTNINYCVKSGDLETLDLAFNQGVPVDVQDQFYKTPLMVACCCGNYEVAQYLLSRGADVNVRDQFFWTALHHAAHAGQLEIIELLLEAGAHVDAQALSGGTPLMRAIQSSRPACVDVLIRAGADVNEKNKKEQSCLDIATAFADPTIIELVQNQMDSLLAALKEKAKAKAQKLKSAEQKGRAADGAVHAGSSTAAAGKTSRKDSRNSIVLQNTRITTGKSDTNHITFVPKTGLVKPPTTSQLMSKIERRKELLSLELDFDDFMMPFSQNVQRTQEHAKTTD